MILTGVEEVLLRASMVRRDELFRRWVWRDASPATDEMREAWASGINNSMVNETVAIFLAAFARLFFQRHQAVLDLGWEEGFSSTALLISVALQLVTEQVTLSSLARARDPMPRSGGGRGVRARGGDAGHRRALVLRARHAGTPSGPLLFIRYGAVLLAAVVQVGAVSAGGVRGAR